MRREYYQAHRDEILAERKKRWAEDPEFRASRKGYVKKWRLKNLSARLVCEAEKREKNREAIRAYHKKWREAHPDNLKRYHENCRDSGKRAAYDASHKGRISELNKIRYRKNPHHFKNKRLKQEYGVTWEWYKAQLDMQGGCCAVCGADPTCQKKMFAVDHDHQTGQVRGIICSRCNVVLDRFDKVPDFAAKAEAYLGQYRGSLNETQNNSHLCMASALVQ
jgi:hypothetical protein